MGEKGIIVNIFQRKMVVIWMSVIFYFIHQTFVAMETGIAFKLLGNQYLEITGSWKAFLFLILPNEEYFILYFFDCQSRPPLP